MIISASALYSSSHTWWVAAGTLKKPNMKGGENT
jgi:hypothetical protein